MSNGRDFEATERDRKGRRKVFYLTFAALALIVGAFLIWKLRGLILPIIVGALLAFLFRLFEICVLKFGSGFGNWELEV